MHALHAEVSTKFLMIFHSTHIFIWTFEAREYWTSGLKGHTSLDYCGDQKGKRVKLNEKSLLYLASDKYFGTAQKGKHGTFNGTEGVIFKNSFLDREDVFITKVPLVDLLFLKFETT